MTYRDLYHKLQSMATGPQSIHLDDHVTVYEAYEDEFIPCVGFDFVGADPDDLGNGVLDNGHPFLVMKA